MKNDLDYYISLYSWFADLETRILKTNQNIDRGITVSLFNDLDILENSKNPKKIIKSCEDILRNIEIITLDCFDSEVLECIGKIKSTVTDGYEKITSITNG